MLKNIIFYMNNNILLETIEVLRYSIRDLKNLIFYKEELLEKLLKKQQSNCQHVWINDSIDKMDGYTECFPIKYCRECEISYKPS